MDRFKSFVFLLLFIASVFGNLTHEFNKTTMLTKVASSSDSNDPIYITPKLLFVGKPNGEILRCLFEDPSVCDVFYSYSSSSYVVNSMVISGEYLYAAINGVMLKCNLQDKDCAEFNKFNQINSLVAADGCIYVGLSNGNIYRCEMHQPNNCKTFKEFRSPVTSLGVTDKYLYVGMESKEFFKCLKTSNGSCRSVDKQPFVSPIYGIRSVEETVIAITQAGTFWNCTRDAPCTYKVYSEEGTVTRFTSMAIFDTSLYALHDSKILVCKLETLECKFYGTHERAFTIAFAYSTYKMQSRFVNEEKTCLFSARCPPLVIYYDINQRPLLEVFVKGGKLYNSQNVLVDTTNADVGQSGRAAIFAMGPDGQILLSNVHSSHSSVLRTSSLFAGHPVAGAGEMVVEDGVIKSIRACSDHYRPTVELNQQVINALRLKGYMDTIDNLPCCTDNECGQKRNIDENDKDGQ